MLAWGGIFRLVESVFKDVRFRMRSSFDKSLTLHTFLTQLFLPMWAISIKLSLPRLLRTDKIQDIGKISASLDVNRSDRVCPNIRMRRTHGAKFNL